MTKKPTRSSLSQLAYAPNPPPQNQAGLALYVQQELQRIALVLKELTAAQQEKSSGTTS